MKPTTLTHQRSITNSATSHVATPTARLNASVATLLNADPTSPSKETAKEENR